MSDLISRQDAIEAIARDIPFITFTEDPKRTAQRIIGTVPSAEPKTGKWVIVHGYVTPGGDPVWKCSECGKGQHVYGIEADSYGADVAEHQWVACPNCGAVMVGEEE